MVFRNEAKQKEKDDVQVIRDTYCFGVKLVLYSVVRGSLQKSGLCSCVAFFYSLNIETYS